MVCSRNTGRWLMLLLMLVAAHARSEAWLIEVEGAIGPATADHMVRGLERAQAAQAELVVLRIDTPGGLDSAMRDMIKAVLASSVPIIGYVSPSGARAASAGTYLLYASHIAAMAPGTNLGAATPVQVGTPGLPSLPDAGGDTADSGKGGASESPATPMERKVVNDAVAYIQSLAQLRGRNQEWAERAVRRGASLSAEDALALGVIDTVADSLEALLDSLHGRELQMGARSQVLQTEALVLHKHPVDWRSSFLAVITNPNIAYILMLLGIYGLVIEFYSPGIGLAGVLGAFCLLLALYAFQVLPISYAGLGLILLGIVLMVAEAFAPSFGVLGLGGVGAFVVGSIMLMDTSLPGYQIAMPMIVACALFSAALLIMALGMILKARKHAVVTGTGHLLGQYAEVEVLREGQPFVRLDGELWHALSDETLAEHDTVRVDAIEGVELKVSKFK